MMRLIKWILCLTLVATGGREVGAFSLLGPFKSAGFNEPWQGTGFDARPQGLGYSLAGDIGGPMTLLEGYRWNVPVITYAFDSTFLRYFGTNGVNAVEEAMSIINGLPSASAMTPDLSEFALDTKGQNFLAGTLGLLDVKSATLSLLLEQLGLANPERFVWSLRHRIVFAAGGQNFTNYTVIHLNYDPVTLQESSYVNGVLYNYRIFDALGPQGAEWASAVEWYQLDPLFMPYSSVAGGLESPDFELGSSPDGTSIGFGGLGAGDYYRGVTRDDAGGLRFLLSTNNFAVESTLPNTFLSIGTGKGGSAWAPFPGGTNVVGTNVTGGVTNTLSTTNLTNFVSVALRPGVNKLTFQRVNFDGLLGSTFTPVTIPYTDSYYNPTNGRIVKQKLQRVISRPDIIFAVGDLGVPQNSTAPRLYLRSGTTGWTNNVALNSAVAGLDLGGPGVINPTVIIRFSDLVPYFENFGDGETDLDAFKGLLWGSFDGSSKPPVVYPAFPDPRAPNLSLSYLQSLVLHRKKN